jgi:DnaK suppressor protein
VSKTPVKQAKPVKIITKEKTTGKTPAKLPSLLAAKPKAAVKKTQLKPSASKTVATKSAPLAVKSPALKSASQPVVKSVPTKPSPQPAPPPLEPTVKSPAPLAPGATAKPAKVVQPRLSAAARASAAASSPAPVPPPTSRFADRFAPPRPPTRQMNSLLVDITKSAQKPDPKLANAWKTKTGRELLDAEVLAMPESEYMKEKQLEFFKIKLQELKENLLTNAGETTEHLREDTSIVPDPADRATIEEEHALELRTRDRERKLLKKISQSLIRIDSGEYGFCDETGEPIGLGRLIARPTATLSLEAQQRRELKQKMFGD